MEPTPVVALVAAARDGDESAWRALVDRYLPLVGAVIARHRLTHADAEDVNQTVWLKLVEHLGDIRDPRALPGWIATTTRHECLRAIAASARTTPLDPQGASPLDRAADASLIEADLLVAERRQALREALLELPASRRDLLVLLLTDPPLPYSEISARLGIPVGSIGPTRGRALDQLRQTAAFRGFETGEPIDRRS